MKNIVLIFASLFCFAISAQCQLAIKPAVGINITDFSKDPSTGESKGKVGYQFGGSVAIGKKFYVEPGIFFLKRSTQVVYEDSQVSDLDFDISGIRIPLALGLNLVGSQKSLVNFRLFGGPSAFILTKVKDLDKDDFKNAQFGLFAGLGLNISLFFAEASYEWSLTNVQEDISQIDVGQTRTVFINAGIRIPL